MAKYPPLTESQKKQISKFKDSSKHPSEIAKEIGLPPEQSPKQIGGYLHFLRRPGIFNLSSNPKQTQAKPEQTKLGQNKSPVPEPKKEEVKTVAIEQSDLEKIQKMINETTTAVQQKTIELTKQAAQDATTHALTNFKETEKREKEKQDAKAKQEQAQVQIDSFCKQFPQLCSRVETLEKKVKEEKPREPEKEIHSTATEYLECKECGPSLIRTMAKMTKANPDFAKKLQETLKAQGITVEIPKEENPPDVKPEESPEGGPF